MSILERYRDMSREDLVARLTALETAPPTASTSSSNVPGGKLERKEKWAGKKKKPAKAFDIRAYPCRKIALRFSYDGASYSGLATQSHNTANGREIETVEDVLWNALRVSRLVGEEARMGDVGWSRCGRTDRGVSAGGQVVALWVRSRKVDEWEQRHALSEYVAEKKREQGKETGEWSDENEDSDEEYSMVTGDASGQVTRATARPDGEELSYVSSLNAVLPPTIRVQAWSPVQPHFSARFNCRYRHYKYFFTSGCPFIEPPTRQGPVPRLDVEQMRYAAQKLLGDHDFRNFCRVDASKQIENFRRRIDGISIDPVSRPWRRSGTDEAKLGSEAETETMFVLNLRGTAFLYHQVRHIVAILFLVGARLEKASIIDELLNVEHGAIARDRLLMRRRGLVLDVDEAGHEYKTMLPASTATSMTGSVASDNAGIDTVGRASFAELDAELTERELALCGTTVYERKPEYEMAAERPLMLWECGFKESDVQWRSGTYDGPLSPATPTNPISGDVNSTTPVIAALLHSKWSSLAIRTEMYKHFVLALPLNVSQTQAGHIPSSTLFQESALPALEKGSVCVDGRRPSWDTQEGPECARYIKPLGDGRFKPLHAYKGLLHAKREETPEGKNANYLQGRGKRRAERAEASM